MKITLLTLALTLFLTVSASARPYAVGDLNADNKVNFKDLQIFSLQWLESSGCFGIGCANLDDVNSVDMADFALLAANWQDIRSHLVISELMARNSTTLLDGNGESSDWIEVYNPTDTSVNLGGWYLTDSASNLTMWQFPEGVKIESGEDV
jgi:hypothetical protein